MSNEQFLGIIKNFAREHNISMPVAKGYLRMSNWDIDRATIFLDMNKQELILWIGKELTQQENEIANLDFRLYKIERDLGLRRD